MHPSRREPSSSRPSVLFVFKNPYVFETAILPTVRDISRDHIVSILVANYYIPESLLTELDELLQSGRIAQFSVIPAYRLPKTADEQVTRSWFSETLFWIDRYFSKAYRKFDIVVSHTGSSISDWLPLVMEGTKDAVYLCAFPVHLPSANSGARSGLRGTVRRVAKPTDVRRIARRARSKVDSVIDRTMVRILSTFSREKLQVPLPVIGNFRFNRYLVATAGEYANLLGQLGDAVVEVVDFHSGETVIHWKNMDSTLLLLLDLNPPTEESVDGIDYAVDWICTALGLSRILVRPHPRDLSTFPELVLDRLSPKYESELALPRYRTLVETVSTAAAVTGGISASVDDSIRIIQGMGSRIPVYRICTCAGGSHRHETKLSQGTVCLEKLWPPHDNPSEESTESTKIQSLTDIIRKVGRTPES